MTLNTLRWEKKQEDWIDPAEGIITSSCGKRQNPILKKEEFHNGLDIAAAEGTAVRAVKSGRVTVVRCSDTFGKVLEMETKDGHKILYAHLSEILVKKGDRVKQGEQVAKMGSTGLSTGSHLHYSVWKGRMLLDPMELVNLPVTEEVRAEYRARGEEFLR